MNNTEEITALAREYAEEMNPLSFYECGNIAERNADLRIDKENAKLLLDWLLRRFYLVEKSKVKEEYNLALLNLEKAGSARPLNQSYFDGRREALESLFPEIGKEVES